MVTRTIITYTDSINGEPDAETVQFALDGWLYSIDLAAANQAKLRTVLEPYVLHAEQRVRLPRVQWPDAVPQPYRPTKWRSPAELAARDAELEKRRSVRAWIGEHWQQLGINEPSPNWLKGNGSIPQYCFRLYEQYQGGPPDTEGQ
jgi:hypothetical protein